MEISYESSNKRRGPRYEVIKLSSSAAVEYYFTDDLSSNEKMFSRVSFCPPWFLRLSRRHVN